MRPRLFNFAAVASVAVCLAALALWARSAWARDEAQWRTGGQVFYATSDRGGFVLYWISHRRGGWPQGTWYRSEPSGLRRPGGLSLRRALLPRRAFDAAWERFENEHAAGVHRTLRLPYWFVLVPTLIVPGMWLARRYQHRHRRAQAAA